MMRNLMFASLLLLTGLTVIAAPGDGEAPPPQESGAPPPPRKEDRSGRQMWRAFSQLSDDERKELVALQARDQDAFRKKLQQKAEEFRKKEEAREQALKNLLEAYRTAAEKDKDALKKQIATFVREDYNRRLVESRRHLESMKRGVEMIEAELAKREKNADAAIGAAVDQMISTGAPIKFQQPHVPPPPVQ